MFDGALTVVDFKIEPRAALRGLEEDARAAVGAADHPKLRRLFAEVLARRGLARPGDSAGQ
jgi:hypothetical protein